MKAMLSVGVVVAVALGAPGGAGAATTLGQLGPDLAVGGTCGPGKAYSLIGGQVSYTAPTAGVITAWAVETNGNPSQQGSIKVLTKTGMPLGNFTFAITGTSAVETLTPFRTNRFATRIPVQAGQVIGYFVPPNDPGGQACRFDVGDNQANFVGGPSTGAPGSSFTTTDGDFSSQKRLNLEATLEGDADGDGFGDETQDRCLGSNGPNGGCPASGGGGGGGGSDTTKPSLTGLSFSATTFRAASSGASASSTTKRKKRPPIGTKVAFRLSESASVRFTVQRKTKGRRSGGKCRKKTTRNASRPKCTLWKSVRGSFTVKGKAGKNSFTFRGRIGGRALGSGSYRLSGVATDGARNASTVKRKGFTIVR